MWSFIFIFVAGYNACYIMGSKMRHHQKGVDYYAEVHTTHQNIVAHVVGMPFTIYGILLWFPTLLRCTIENAWRVQCGLFILYLGHYLRINLETVKVYSVMYLPPLLMSISDYTPGFKGFLYGGVISTGALVFQEYVGHYLGNDPPSRLEAIPNAIGYAVYFSADSLKKYVRDFLNVCEG
jgi:hypothetical protein